MGIPLRQQIRVGAYVLKQRLRGRDRYPLVLMLEPLVPLQSRLRRLRQDRLSGADPEPAPVGRGVPRRGRRMRRADRLDPGRRTADPQGDRRDREGVGRAQEVRLPVHQRAPGREEDRPVHAEPLPHLLDPSRRAARAPRPLGLPGRRVRPRGRGDPAAARARLPRQRQRHAVRRRRAGARSRRSSTTSPRSSTSRASRCRPATPTSGRPTRRTSSTGARPSSCSATSSARGRGKRWRLNHSSLYLDFLAGNQDYRCTPWGNPTRNIFGWQRPCYLLGEGYARTFKELMETTDWDALRHRQLREMRQLHGALRLRGDRGDRCGPPPAEGARGRAPPDRDRARRWRPRSRSSTSGRRNTCSSAIVRGCGRRATGTRGPASRAQRRGVALRPGAARALRNPARGSRRGTARSCARPGCRCRSRAACGRARSAGPGRSRARAPA